MDVEFKLKDLKSLNATSIKGSTNAQYGVESDLNEWMYGLCRRVVPVQCVYALPECLHDHIIAGLYIENTAANTAVRFYGLKTPSVFQKPIEVLRLFEKEFPDDVGWFNQCSGWAVRRSEAEGFVDINEDDADCRSGDFFCTVVTTPGDEHIYSSAVSRQPSVTHNAVYRKPLQSQVSVTGHQMSDAVKHLEKQCSDTTLPNNAVSVEPNSYNAPANRCAQEDVITQQCTGAELCSGPPVIGQQTSDSPQGGNMAMVPGVKFATEGTAEQVTPNYPLEGLMVTGRSTREGFGRCPFLDGRPEELTCYVHALDLACKVPMNVCSLECKDQLVPYMATIQRELQALDVSDTASDTLKSYILSHCQSCRRLQCDVPHMAAGCPRPGTWSATRSPYTTTTSSAGIQSRAEVNTIPTTNLHTINTPTPQIRTLVAPRVSYDQERFQNSSSVDMTDAILEDDPDTDCRLHIPRGDAGVRLPSLQAVYLVPGSGGKGAHINQLLVQSREDLPHDISRYAHGTVIYSSKKTDNIQDMQHIFSPGSQNSWIPNFLDPSIAIHQTELGRGGNGITFGYTLSDTDFAVKETKYRQNEIQLWRQFDHPNVIPLLAVISLKGGRCLQFMPRMNCNLRDEVRKVVNVKSLLTSSSGGLWEATVQPNLKHILRCVLEGLSHLHDVHHVQHSDIKPHNILIQYQCSHNHATDSVFCCTEEKRCSVKICDFDSVKGFRSSCYKADKTTPKTEKEIDKVLGTKGYRAPEKFLKPQGPTALCAEMEGSWCDIWSFGSCVLYIFLGPDDKKDAGMFKKERDDSDERMEPIVRVLKMFTEHPPLQAAGTFAARCLKPQPMQRPSAQELLKDPFLR